MNKDCFQVSVISKIALFCHFGIEVQPVFF